MISAFSPECRGIADPRGLTYSAGLDVQSSGNDHDLHRSIVMQKSGNMKHNVPGCGVSVMSFQKKHYIGMKVEDTLLVGKRLKLTMTAGRMGDGGQGCCCMAGALKLLLLGRDYPVRNDKMTLSFHKRVGLGGWKSETEFCPKRGMRLRQCQF
ncbi:hypothetical protein Cgig2_027827 [Carnegiea gigantea]|uniref:Translocase of chloroplast 159/132 membrane anchor domain-containing protein n=1 Tax=Carnegiea gigantea TaxID=171969 RepID=A0A9Q1QAY7_9CARY|nr:hypothetical protein Cgig2_027827 [Carnegiea gigantea]